LGFLHFFLLNWLYFNFFLSPIFCIRLGLSFLKEEWYSILICTVCLGGSVLTTGVMVRPQTSISGTNISNSSYLLVLLVTLVVACTISATCSAGRSILFWLIERSARVI
jgi:hypothetical protein